MAVLVTKWFGAFVTEGAKTVREARFPLDAASIALRLKRIRADDVLDEEKGLAQPNLEVLEPRLRTLGTLRASAPTDIAWEEPDRRILRDAALRVARDESRQAAGEPDRSLAQSVRVLEELDRSLNTLVERIREWYGLHYPEALGKIAAASSLVEHLARDPHRDAIQALVPGAPSDSIGVEFSAPELEAVKGFAQSLHLLYQERARIERLVSAQAARVAPSLCQLVGEQICAKLIARAGSLERLAFLPASTVQTLGAETSLFQHLKEGTKPPKHGVLFQHALINTAPRWQRGRLARVLANAALLAARADHFRPGTTDSIGPLRARLEAQIERIKKSKPPAPKPRPPPAWQAKARPSGRRERPIQRGRR